MTATEARTEARISIREARTVLNRALRRFDELGPMDVLSLYEAAGQILTWAEAHNNPVPVATPARPVLRAVGGKP